MFKTPILTTVGADTTSLPTKHRFSHLLHKQHLPIIFYPSTSPRLRLCKPVGSGQFWLRSAYFLAAFEGDTDRLIKPVTLLCQLNTLSCTGDICVTFHQDCCTYIHHLLPGSRTQDSTWHVGKSDSPCVQFCSPRFSHSKLIHRNKLAKSKTVSFSGCLDRHMLPSRYSTTVCEDTAYLCSVLPETVSRTVWDCSTQAFLQVTKKPPQWKDTSGHQKVKRSRCWKDGGARWVFVCLVLIFFGRGAFLQQGMLQG